MRTLLLIVCFVLAALHLEAAERVMISYKPKLEGESFTIKIPNIPGLTSFSVKLDNATYMLDLEYNYNQNLYLIQKTADYKKFKKELLESRTNGTSKYTAVIDIGDGREIKVDAITLASSSGNGFLRLDDPEFKLDSLSMKIAGVEKMGISATAGKMGFLYEWFGSWATIGLVLSPRCDYYDQGNYKFSSDLSLFYKYQYGLEFLGSIEAGFSGFVSKGDAYQKESSWQGKVSMDVMFSPADFFQLRGHGQFNKIEGDGCGSWFVSDLSAFAYVFLKKTGVGVGYQMNNDNTVADDRIKQYLVLKYIFTFNDNTQQSFEVKLLDKEGPVVGGSLSLKL